LHIDIHKLIGIKKAGYIMSGQKLALVDLHHSQIIGRVAE